METGAAIISFISKLGSEFIKLVMYVVLKEFHSVESVIKITAFLYFAVTEDPTRNISIHKDKYNSFVSKGV